VVVSPPGEGAGWWAGAPSAVLVDGTYYLAYRLRAPIGRGRGFANVVGRSRDGVHFETLCTLDRDAFGADSLERPALVPLPDGRWRIYVSCSTPGSKHWRVDMLEADDPEGFDPRRARTVMPGDAEWGVKDPVIAHLDGLWHVWLCCHPLRDPAEADRMLTRHGTSTDGVHWQLGDVALRATPGSWDSRGTRVTAVLPDGSGFVAYYDGRASAEENWEERTGMAAGNTPSHLAPVADKAVGVSPTGSGSLRYLSVVQPPGGGYRLYYEVTLADGAHDLRTEDVPPP